MFCKTNTEQILHASHGYFKLNESTKSVFFFLQQHQHSEKNQEILTLRQHIQILQQEHLSKISRIAELEAQLQSLKVQSW